MSTVVKDLGAVSAYAYAVEKGYTGTEAEFAELMADYAEVGQRAEDAADSALESKTAAQTAATTATNKATEATTAATTATTKAGEASTSASTATSAKDTAVSASQTATSKASEATTAAATATSAASTATTAKDDAVSAKTAAQTAQTGAETAAASVSASAEQIATNTDDIAQLKSDLNSGDFMTKEGHFTDAEKALDWSTSTRKIQYQSNKNSLLMEFSDTSSGTKTVSCAFGQMSGFDSTSVQFSTTDYPYVVLRTTSNLPNAAGSKFRFYIYSADGTAGDEVAVNLTNGDNLIIINLPKLITDSGRNASVKTLIEPDGIRTESYTYTDAPSVSVYFMGMFTDAEGENYNLAESIANLNLEVSEIKADNTLTKKLGELNLFDETSTVFGILNEDGSISQGNLSKLHIASDYIEIDPSEKYVAQIWERSTGDFWVRMVWFDSSKNVLSYTNDFVEQSTIGDYKYSALTLTPPTGAAYLRLCMHTNGDGRAKIERGNVKSAWTHGLGAVLNHKSYNTADIYPLKSIVHRGNHTSAPENTIPAYIAAKKTDWYFVETDVGWTADGTPVLMHDETINRTCCNASDGSAIVGDVSIGSLRDSELSNYDACTPSQWAVWHGTKIPTFEEFILLCRNIDLHPYIELKTYQSPTPAQIGDLVEIVRKYGMSDSVTWISFSNTLLQYVKASDKKARMGILESSYDSRTQVNAKMLKTVNNEVFVDAVTSIVNATLVNECASYGLPLEVYCPDTEADMLSLNPYVSGATSNLLKYADVIKNDILED